MYQIETPNNYTIACVEGQKFLIDTGCPFSVGDKPLTFEGTTHYVGKDFVTLGRDIHTLGSDIGCPDLTHLVGLDFLRQHPFKIDFNEKTIKFLDPEYRQGGEIVPVQVGAEIKLRFEVNGTTVQGIVDTGCPMIMKSPSFNMGTPSGEKLHDFKPEGGGFTSDVWYGEVKIGSRRFKSRIGELKGIMAKAIEMFHGGWLVGADLWMQGPVGFDAARGTMHLY